MSTPNEELKLAATAGWKRYAASVDENTLRTMLRKQPTEIHGRQLRNERANRR
jgi:hypothetical protein